MTDMTIPQITLQQLGGARFRAMTGAKDFAALTDGRTLRFRLPGKSGFVSQGINHVEIRLDESDTYTIKFYRVKRKAGDLMPTITEIEKREDIYCDVLQEVFTRVTGLATRL